MRRCIVSLFFFLAVVTGSETHHVFIDDVTKQKFAFILAVLFCPFPQRLRNYSKGQTISVTHTTQGELNRMEDGRSDINGSGWGSSHRWERKGTALCPCVMATGRDYDGLHLSPGDKSSRYKCRLCGEWFNHHYDLVSNIFDAMKESGVTEKCPSRSTPITPRC